VGTYCVFQDCFHTSETLNHVCAVCVKIPELSVVALARPPERVGLHVLVDLELRPSTETLVEAECATVFLKQGIYPPVVK
jgi:hypothetical protein